MNRNYLLKNLNNKFKIIILIIQKIKNMERQPQSRLPHVQVSFTRLTRHVN